MNRRAYVRYYAFISLIALVCLTMVFQIARIFTSESNTRSNKIIVNEGMISSCISDDDCVLQEVSCNNCGCPYAINKHEYQEIVCQENKYGVGCDIYCPLSESRCTDNMCTTIVIEKGITN